MFKYIGIYLRVLAQLYRASTTVTNNPNRKKVKPQTERKNTSTANP